MTYDKKTITYELNILKSIMEHFNIHTFDNLLIALSFFIDEADEDLVIYTRE